jgi:hypothetical protein
MATLHALGKSWVFNACYTSVNQLVTEVELPIGTECRIVHCAQDQVPDQLFSVEEWMLLPPPRKIVPSKRSVRLQL